MYHNPQKKLSDKGYQDPQAFVNDVELIFSNAFTFNEEGSIVHNDAKILQVKSPTSPLRMTSDLRAY